MAFHNRGNLFFYNGDFEKAAADLLRVNDLKDDAMRCSGAILRSGTWGRTAQAELSANATRLRTKSRLYAVIDFYLGRRSLDEMRTAAGNANDKCESPRMAAS